MKKLMITAAALLTACVVGAAVQGGTRVSGTDFNSYPTGAFDPALDDNGSSDTGTYWTTTQAGESVVEEETQGDNILKIDESVPLYRNMYKSNENKQSATVSLEQSVYFQSKVKFTASEDETITPSEGDKLIVWVRATEENPTTNLIVTAGIYEDGQWGTTNYVVDQSIDVDNWHDLEIVAKIDDSVLKFEVKVDGSAVTSDQTTLFPSLDQYSDAKSTITCAGFKGTGSIDDIEFGTIAENPTKYYEVDGVEYIEFADAFEAAASAGETLTLINDAVLEFNSGDDAGYYNEEDTIIIDLNGHSITCEGTVFLNDNDGDMTIVDSVGGGSVVNTLAEDDDEEYSIVSSGSLTITGGAFMGEVLNDDGELEVTLNGAPAELVLDEDSESDTCGYYIIQASGEQPPEPTVVQIPTAASNLVYDGTEQTGVAAGTGYTLTGTAAATNAGDYSATATLEEGYIWSDESTEAKTINWSIAKAQVTATVSLTVTSATYDSEKDDVTDYTTPSVNFGLGAPELVEDTDYTVAWDETEVTGAGTFTYTVSPVAASNYTFTEASATLTITEGGDEYPSYIEDITDPTAKAAYEAKYDTWATTYSVADGAGNEDAFLLNCAPADVETAKANFKIPSITVDAEGNVTVGTIEGTFNGKLQLKGSTDLSTWTNLDAPSKSYNFFKYELTY